MNEPKHTPGPWRTEYDETGGYDCLTAAYRIKGMEEQVVAVIDLANYQAYGAGHNGDAAQRAKDAEAGANARRIVACVNACEGLSIEQLERFPLDSFKEYAQSGIASMLHELELEKQRDELLTLLEAIYNAHRTDNNGAYMGEAVFCESFARRARDLIAKCKEG